jgi:single-strand DNA-binding protein
MHHKTTIIGNIGADPEVKILPSGDAVANFSVAVNEKWKDKQTGEMREHTEWYRCSAFGRLAQMIGEFRKKGDLVFIEGRNKTRSWETENGEKRYATDLRVDTMRGLSGSKSASGGQQGQASASQQNTPPRQPQDAGQPNPDDFNDDIPF